MNAKQWNNLMISAGSFVTEARSRIKPEYRDALDACIRKGGHVEVRLSIGLADLRARLVAIESDGSEWQAGGELVMKQTQTEMEA